MLPFAVLPSKRKRGIRVDVAASCAERRDQRRGREEMRAWGGGGERRREEEEEEEGGVGREKGPFH